MKYDFDEIVERRNTGSVKYDMKNPDAPDGVLPMWVADMDFRVPPEVVRALGKRVRHGVFGYGEAGEKYYRGVCRWFAGRYQWKVDREWIVPVPGVVYAISMAVRALTEEGAPVLIQQPVYHLFEQSIVRNNRVPVVNRLHYENGRYSIDFWEFERQIIKNNIKLFVLCSPHNPVGRVWKRNELLRMGEICYRHGVKVVSDEIHADFIYNGSEHHVFANLKPNFSDIAVTCTSPTKTFNFPGLQVSNIVIENEELREKFCAEVTRDGYGEVNVMGTVACQTAYGRGTAWLEELLVYLQGNTRLIRDAVRDMPGVSFIRPQGTYLGWLDCTGLDMDDDELDAFMLQKAGLWLSSGYIFGQGGSGFMRINFGCPRSVVEEAMERLAGAVKSITR